MESSAFLPTECDLIMEGGVTSGVVFPSFIVKLASRFDLRNIGGTSVGAVAAVTAAAAQYRRNAVRATGGTPAEAEAGYSRLGTLPEWLQGTSELDRSNLFSLFQPAAQLKPHFGLIETALNRKNVFHTIAAVLGGLLRYFPKGAIVALVAAQLIHALYVRYGLHMPMLPADVKARLLALVWMLAWSGVAAVAGAAAQCVVSGLRGLRQNRCGICPGLSQTESAHQVPALTEWLHALVQEIAGRPADRPLTFGDLRASAPSIELAFMTTGISELKAHRLPHASEDLLFRVSELSHLFPPSVIAWMRDHARTPSDTSLTMMRANDPNMGSREQDLYFLPVADELPIVFAARLSLSFPVLLQAVPLYRLRYVDGNGVQTGSLAIARIWLSDGGLSSNFPIHFFDSLLPNRPTFGITLAATLDPAAPPGARVYLPTNNRQGLTGTYFAIDAEDGLPSLGGFAAAVLATIRGWRDEALKRTPGFRDRIVQIKHTAAEGGLNLNMKPEAIAAMSASGVDAADAIIARFLDPDPMENGWLNHRIVRMRTATTVLQEKLAPVGAAWSGTTTPPSYQALWNGTSPQVPNAYPVDAGQREVGDTFWTHLCAASAAAAAADLSQKAPRPRPTLEITPGQD